MNKYKITGIKNGKKKIKTLRAKTPEEAKNKALSLQITPIEICPHKQWSFFSSIKKEILISYFEQMILLLHSFLPLDEIIMHCANTQNTKLNLILMRVFQNLKEGKDLKTSFLVFGKTLKPLHYMLIESGEKTGRLVEHFTLIKQDLQEQNHYKKRMQKALFYPMIVFFSIIMAFFLAISLIIPEFQGFFDNNQAKLPWITLSLIALDSFIKNFFPLIILCIILCIGIFIVFYRKQKYKIFIHKLFLKIPLIRNIILYYRLDVFFQTMYFFQITGNDIKHSLYTNLELLDNQFLKQDFLKIYLLINEGNTLKHSFSQSQFLDSITLALLSSGEESGKIDKVFLHIAERYRMLHQNILENLLLYLEPLATFFSAIMVLYLTLGIFLPIWILQDIAL